MFYHWCCEKSEKQELLNIKGRHKRGIKLCNMALDSVTPFSGLNLFLDKKNCKERQQEGFCNNASEISAYSKLLI